MRIVRTGAAIREIHMRILRTHTPPSGPTVNAARGHRRTAGQDAPSGQRSGAKSTSGPRPWVSGLWHLARAWRVCISPSARDGGAHFPNPRGR